MNKNILLLALIVGFVFDTFSQSKNTNIVINGDFESGYLDGIANSSSHNFVIGDDFDFYSDFGYKTNVDQQGCNYSFADSYGVSKNHRYVCSFFNEKGIYYGNGYCTYNGGHDSLVFDHTLGIDKEGYLLAIDQHELKESKKYTGFYPLMWEKQVAVDPDSAYDFSVFIANWSGTECDSIRLVIRSVDTQGDLIATYLLDTLGLKDDTLMVYHQLKTKWICPDTVFSVRLGVELMVDGFEYSTQGNDFIIDDISFTTTDDRDLTGINMVTLKEDEVVLAVFSNNENEEVVVFPNPVDEILTLSGKYNYWTVSDQIGQQLFYGREPEINLSSLVSGMYFLTVDGKVYKIIKK